MARGSSNRFSQMSYMGSRIPAHIMGVHQCASPVCESTANPERATPLAWGEWIRLARFRPRVSFMSQMAIMVTTPQPIGGH